MRRSFALVAVAVAVAVAAAMCVGPASGRSAAVDPVAAGRIEPHPGAAIPLAPRFTTSAGEIIRLGDLIDGSRPALLAPVYYRCPNICGATLAGLFDAVGRMPLTLGDDFTVIAFSIDPADTQISASEARKRATAYLPRPPPTGSVTFLTGTAESISKVKSAIGFHSQWDPDLQQFAHAAGVLAVTADGHAGTWIYGVAPSTEDLRKALAPAAARAGLAQLGDRIFLLCFHYDPQTGQYTPLIGRILTIAGVATVLAVAAGIVLLGRRDRRTGAGL